ncbi:restriction endonuclease [Kitasatospora sp. NPDC002040]|uniref:restriction endonuclease n=1 Tax=Kitasatospora sp. NPDC002040 TaxID=3154661 RepID=UPI0033309142
MGFDTYLQVDGQTVLQWRKDASPLPRLLFRFDQLEIKPPADDDSWQVAFACSVGSALENLERAGFGWHATVDAYSDNRFVEAGAYGIKMADVKFRDLTDEQARAELEEFVSLPAESDLSALGALMVAQWMAGEDLILLSELTYEGDLERSWDYHSRVFDGAERFGIVDPYRIFRAVESLTVLDRSAPLICWPMIVCTFLKHLPQDLIISFDISEDAAQEDVDGEDSAHEYAARYWEVSGQSLVGVAQTLGRLFGVLSGFDNALGREFWFARSAGLLGKLRSISGDGGGLSAKARGDILEALMEAILRTEEPELEVVEKNFRTAEEEIDILVTNGLRDPFWVAQGSPLILIECKNWKNKPGVPELRVFESKMKDRSALCKIGIFVSMAGFTRPFLARLKAFQAQGGIIFALDGDDLEELVSSKTRLTDWLRGAGVRRALGKLDG